MKKIFCFPFLFLFLGILNAKPGSGCEWENQVCVSYCSQTVSSNNGDLPQYKCFKAGDATLEHPVTFYTCFNDPSEQIYPLSPGPSQPPVKYRLAPQFLLCLPINVCWAQIKIYEVSGDDVLTLIAEDNDVYLDTNRDTPCDYCPVSNHYWTMPHGSYKGLLGKYKAEISYKCCGSDEAVSFSFYYEIQDAASAADVNISGFLATNMIENINNDPNLDGFILAGIGGANGPELGPLSSGVRVSTVGSGVTQYKVSLYLLDCFNPGFSNLVHTVTIPYNGTQIIDYKFLDIPNWGTIFVPNGCYRVDVEVTSICGTFSKSANFTLTDQCVFCFSPDETEERNSMPTLDQRIKIAPNPATGFASIKTTVPIHKLQVINSSGQLINDFTFNQTDKVFHEIAMSTEGVYYVRLQTTDGQVYTQKVINIK